MSREHPRELMEFQWHRHAGGYHWIDSPDIPREPTQRVLTSGVPLYTTVELVRYAPLQQEPMLYAHFADLPGTEGAIRAFATRYGLLGLNEVMVSVEGSLVGIGERLRDWRTEILTMRAVLRGWGEFNAEVQRVRRAPPRRVPDHAARLGGALLERLNRRLREHTQGRVLWRDPAREELGLYLMPTTLCGALWVQVARMIEQKRPLGRCKACGEPIALTRSDRRYCGSRCRMRQLVQRRRRRRPG